jgi:hypothetical protein
LELARPDVVLDLGLVLEPDRLDRFLACLASANWEADCVRLQLGGSQAFVP